MNSESSGRAVRISGGEDAASLWTQDRTLSPGQGRAKRRATPNGGVLGMRLLDFSVRRGRQMKVVTAHCLLCQVGDAELEDMY